LETEPDKLAQVRKYALLGHFHAYLDDEYDGPVVWLALAVSQSQLGVGCHTRADE
jgi:hypothetical protein